MSRHRGHTGRTDANQQAIVQALRHAGVSVCSLAGCGDGVPDLLCSILGRTLLIEAKTGKGALTPAQEAFVVGWQGELHIVRSVDQALAVALGRKVSV